MTVRNAIPADFAEILALQHLNHLSNLAPDARFDGFLTTQLTPDKMAELSDQNGMVVARTNECELAGYACGENWDPTGERAFHLAVLHLFPLRLGDFSINAHNSFQYGPICVAAPFRGAGFSQLLLHAIQANFRARCNFGITFIDHRNARSLAAHERKLGLQILTNLPYDDTIYHVLGFSTRPNL